MMSALSLAQVATEIGGTLSTAADCQFSRLSTDTRAIKAGDLFVALRGENFDAHDFLAQATKAQACAVVVEKTDSSVALPQLQVADTTKALGQIAAINRRAFTGPLIAVTGSCGKTTVKGMISSILQCCGEVHATAGNFNNHIGMPLTLLELLPQHQYAVIEMGASAIGEIAYLVDLAKPDIVLVNNVMPAHVEGFGSIDGVAKAKGEIYQGLSGEGKAIINIDEPYAEQWLSHVQREQVISVSASGKTADFSAENIVEHESDDGNSILQFVMASPLGRIDIQLSLMGRHNVANALAAAACAYAAGAGVDDIQQGLKNFEAVTGRMNRQLGLNGSLVIDDTYNANPGSVMAAIDALVHCEHGTSKNEKILVLGDMAELGVDAESLHKELGLYAAQAGVDQFLTVGSLSESASQAFGKNGRHCLDHAAAIAALKEKICEKSIVLVKGSRSAKMEVVVSALVGNESTQCGDK